MPKLDQRVAIVTGGGTGIGRGIALELANAGADVIISGRNLANLEKVTKEIGALGRTSTTVAADITSAAQVRNLVDQTISKFGRIDILVNNAGIGRRDLIVDMPEEIWDATIATNLKGTFLCTQAVARHMIEQKYGKIINIASISGIRANRPGLAAYSATKAGIMQLTRSTALELGPYGVNVNCVAPGAVETPQASVGHSSEKFAAWKEREGKQSIMGRMVQIQDIAKLALFLASDDSSFICGETIVLDGGRSCQGYFGVIGISIEDDEKFRIQKKQNLTNLSKK
jgi:3-oxoacyl-[acyl-carrier protein] reductase